METIALHIGYVILGILGVELFLFAIFVLWLTVIGFRWIWTTKSTIRFLRKHEEKVTYEALNTALKYLLSKGASKSHTLEEVAVLIERFRKECRISNNEDNL